MSAEQEGPESLAVLVADGSPTNWDEALRSASSDHDRRIIEQLRLVERVARVLRGPAADSDALPVSLPPPPEPVEAHGSWGPLELRERLGEGGFGEVYRAFDRRLDREVALKLLKKSPSRSTNVPPSSVVEEGRLLAKLRHPNVVTVYGAEVHDDRVGVWMELVKGRSLEQLLREHGAFGAREAALIGADLCRALAAVHGAGVIHRDVKAANAMREEGGRILLMDFGAGIEVDVERGEASLSLSGTPLYMAPELFLDAPASAQTDIYSLGVLLYRLVSRAFPIEATGWSELRRKHERREVRLLRDLRPDLPEAFVAVVERATAWRPEDRFTSPGQMEKALTLALGSSDSTAATDGSLPPARRGSPRRLALLVGTVLGLAATALGVATLHLGASRRDATGSEQRNAEPLERAEPSSSGHAISGPRTREVALEASAGVQYTVEASLIRVAAGSGRRERLDSGARLALGDDLTLEFKSSAPLYVYVINEDEAGHSFALFPLPDLDRKNPLPQDTTLVLPGARNGKNVSWSVDSQGGREHLMILASPTRLVPFEAELSSLARAGQMAVSIPEAAQVYLRGIGGMHETPTSSGGQSAGRLFEMAQRMATHREVVSGVWMRQIELENPRDE